MSRSLVCEKRCELGMEYGEKRPLKLEQAWGMRGEREGEEGAVVNRSRQNQLCNSPIVCLFVFCRFDYRRKEDEKESKNTKELLIQVIQDNRGGIEVKLKSGCLLQE